MKKIVILGCENSHANAFLGFIQKDARYADVEVLGVYSDDRAAAEKLQNTFGVPVMNHYADAVGAVDGVIITARHGDNHYKYAEPYIESGVPLFIDKPITVNEEEAVSFIQRLAQKGTRISGGSSLKQDTYVAAMKKEAADEIGGKTLGGFVRAPYSADNAYGGFYFYAQHLVEMVGEIFGRFPLTVTAKQNGGQLHVLFHYEAYDCVGLFCDKNYVYHISRMSEQGVTAYTVPTTNEWFAREFAEFYDILSGAPSSIDYRSFIAPVFVMNAIMRSLASGKEEALNPITL